MGPIWLGNRVNYGCLMAKIVQRRAVAMGDERPLVRQWLVLKTLSARRNGVTVRELAEEHGVGQKTIRRDLETFQSAGFPLEEITQERGRKAWRLVASVQGEPPLPFAFDEAIALYLGRRLLEPLAGTPFWDASQRAFRKIRTALGPSALRYIDRFAVIFHQTATGNSDYTEKTELVDRLVEAIEDRRAVFLTYQSLRSTEPVTYDAYPYGLVYHRGSLYLVGHAPRHDSVRHWKFDRMDDVQFAELIFPAPEGFDLREHLAGSFGVFQGDGEIRIRIRFAKPVVRYVQESRWHSSQQLTLQPDGSLLAEFQLDHTEEIKRWVLSFGRNAVVEEPVDLRREIVEELEAMVGAYQSPAPSAAPVFHR